MAESPIQKRNAFYCVWIDRDGSGFFEKIRYNSHHFNGMQMSAFASESSKPRQVRKEAAVVGMSCAEMSLICGHPYSG